jgi:regulatory protein
MRGKFAPDLSEQELRDSALRFLGHREYGVEELRRKLLGRGAESGMVDTLVSALVEEDLLSDHRYTEMYVRMRIRLLFGPLKIKGELRSRGIADSVIGQYLPADDQKWFETASQWAAKRQRGELDFKLKGKIYRSLVNRGYTHEQANVALDSLKPESPD